MPAIILSFHKVQQKGNDLWVERAVTDLFTGRVTVVGREPTRAQLGDGGDVHDTVMQVPEQARHAPPEELHVHVHRVAGQARLPGLRVPRHECQQLRARAVLSQLD